MCKKNYLKNIFKNGGLFVLIIIITFYLMFKNRNIAEILHTATKVSPTYIIIAIGCMCLFVCCEAINIRRALKIYNYDTPFYKCIRYALTGFFFSAITPMSSGGQPMQIYYMYKDDIQISHSALVLMMELASFQFVTVTTAVLAFIFKYDFFDSIGYQIKYILMVGVFLNTFILGLIIMAFFSKGILEKCLKAVLHILSKLHFKKIDQLREKAMNQLELYQKGATDIKANKVVIIKIFITTTLQIMAFHSIPFWIYKAFGYDEYSLTTVIAMQAVLYITVSAIPLPGSVGASESGFILIFRTLFPAQVINSAMLLSRGISFYLFLCISGIFLAVFHLLNRNSRMDNKQIINLNIQK